MRVVIQITYAVQMYRVLENVSRVSVERRCSHNGTYGATGSGTRVREAYLYNFVRGECIDASTRQQFRSFSGPTENLEKHRDRIGDVGHVSKCKVACSVVRMKYEVHIRPSDLRYPGSTRVDERVEIALVEREFMWARR